MLGIELWEDNGGFLYLVHDNDGYCIGPDPEPGFFVEDARAWANGEWDPEGELGRAEDWGARLEEEEYRNSDLTKHIATWTPEKVLVAVGGVPGAAGRRYLGITD